MNAHVLAEELRPPRGLKTFYVRMIHVNYTTADAQRHSRGLRQHATYNLSDDELAWVIRTALAERDRRDARRQRPLQEVS